MEQAAQQQVEMSIFPVDMVRTTPQAGVEAVLIGGILVIPVVIVAVLTQFLLLQQFMEMVGWVGTVLGLRTVALDSSMLWNTNNRIQL
jgi:hypothetical protein